jgi:hypothetical protein
MHRPWQEEHPMNDCAESTTTVTLTVAAYVQAFHDACRNLEFAAIDYVDRRRVRRADAADIARKLADEFGLALRDVRRACGVSSSSLVRLERELRELGEEHR